MKKIFLTAAVFMATQTLFGQSIFDRLSYGIKAGANYSDFTGANFATEGSAGFHAGIIINLKLTNNLSIQEDFLYSTQGAKAKSATSVGTEDLKLSYLSVPIVLKYHTELGVYVEAGGQAGILQSDAKNTAFEDFANKVDFGAVGGVGYQFRQGAAKGLGIGARYYQGLTGVGKFNSSTINSDFKNSTAQLSVFYIF